MAANILSFLMEQYYRRTYTALSCNHLQVRTFDMERPEGWISVPLRPINIDDPHAEEPSEGEQKKQIEIEG